MSTTSWTTFRRLAGNKSPPCFDIDVFITIDSNLVYQQKVGVLPFGVVVLAARSNRLGDLLPLVSDILAALSSVGPGQVLRIGG